LSPFASRPHTPRSSFEGTLDSLLKLKIMRLIHAGTAQLQEFSDHAIPPYAILSHTWEEGEVSFKDMLRPTVAQKRPGYTKIRYACKQALLDGLDHVWVDTCCIDKSSSSELSEAINSMFKWYAGSNECYAFLADVESPDPVDLNNARERLEPARWFCRGWTLQELIAPRTVVFYGKDWKRIGTKRDLCADLSLITRVDESLLRGQYRKNRQILEFNEDPWHNRMILDLQQFSIATRMSWASNRVTTRPEDKAYCLMGIFNVHMPLLYGEGEGAFRRLQEEIMRGSDDHSIFAWWPQQSQGLWLPSDLLAPSPEEFAQSGNVVPFQTPQASSYSMTNRGLQINLPIRREDNDGGRAIALLNCYLRQDLDNYIAIHIYQPYNMSGGNDFTRKQGKDMPLLVPRLQTSEFHVEMLHIHGIQSSSVFGAMRNSGLTGNLFVPRNNLFKVVGVASDRQWDSEQQVLRLNRALSGKNHNIRPEGASVIWFEIERFESFDRRQERKVFSVEVRFGYDTSRKPLFGRISIGKLYDGFDEFVKTYGQFPPHVVSDSNCIKLDISLDGKKDDSVTQISVEVQEEDVMGWVMWVVRFHLSDL
jgi:Heterokaryon incompatibility protein (HET)